MAAKEQRTCVFAHLHKNGDPYTRNRVPASGIACCDTCRRWMATCIKDFDRLYHFHPMYDTAAFEAWASSSMEPARYARFRTMFDGLELHVPERVTYVLGCDRLRGFQSAEKRPDDEQRQRMFAVEALFAGVDPALQAGLLARLQARVNAVPADPLQTYTLAEMERQYTSLEAEKKQVEEKNAEHWQRIEAEKKRFCDEWIKLEAEDRRLQYERQAFEAEAEKQRVHTRGCQRKLAAEAVRLRAVKVQLNRKERALLPPVPANLMGTLMEPPRPFVYDETTHDHSLDLSDLGHYANEHPEAARLRADVAKLEKIHGANLASFMYSQKGGVKPDQLA